MKVEGKHYRTIWLKEDSQDTVQIIDQRSLPHRFIVEDLSSLEEVALAIKEMHVRGAGLIGATAGYGMYIASLHASKRSETIFLKQLEEAGKTLVETRPTAVNLEWAVKRQLDVAKAARGIIAKQKAVYRIAKAIADEDAESCRQIGLHGLGILEEISHKKDCVNILTHCNAGWLAFVDYGTATSPIYMAHDRGIPVHVWVDETRPRNQGSRLTAWELGQHGVPHTIIVDNAGGHLMQHGKVDLVLTGSDRTTITGDVANKIGTYLKALAAQDNKIPFYVALPSTTIDWKMRDGLAEIPIEQRGDTEVKKMSGLYKKEIVDIKLTPQDSPAANYAFDITPSRLVTGLITERGICKASEEDILRLYPEKLNNM